VNTLQRMLFFMILKAFLSTLVLLSFVLMLVEFFQHLMTYLNYGTSIFQILKIHFFYIPSCLHLALPLAVLFAISYALGNLYSNNELISVFSSGFSLNKLVFPIIVFSIFVSIFSFLFQEFVVLDSLAKKNSLQSSSTSRHYRSDKPQSGIDKENNIIYYADYFVVKALKLKRAVIIERNDKNQLLVRIDAESAKWQEDAGYWELREARVFTWNADRTFLEESYFPVFTSDKLTLNPKIFKSVEMDVEELRFMPAWRYLTTLKESGRRDEYLKGVTPLYRRLTFAFVNLIVAMIACTIGSWFKKNILIISIGLSLGLAVVYYVFQMITVLLAKNGYVPPLIGAMLPELVFTFVGLNLFKNART